ncbi:hypothetical protein COB11_03020 [Candidatus Aerophobetes bacterium]|uniref:Uncharacterized protein n=1 Tax=Aerophobetes bacterium TaxID=2030807 RepID=A0A2A4YK54_UNCAE|nr:MAG: hypothetical protein COB11_03020 [Candidatus Aerophobetes bacterium]
MSVQLISEGSFESATVHSDYDSAHCVEDDLFGDVFVFLPTRSCDEVAPLDPARITSLESPPAVRRNSWVGEEEEVAQTAQPQINGADHLEKIDRVLSKKLFKNLSGYELDLLVKLFSKEPENAEKLNKWLELILDGKGKQARKEVQLFLRKHIKFKNTLSMAFHHDVKKWREKSAAGRVKSLAKHTAKLVFSPLLLVVGLLKSTGKIALSSSYRKTTAVALKTFIKTRSFNYKTRRNIASFMLKLGIAGIVSLAISGEIATCAATTPLIVAGVVGGTGLLAKIANDTAQHKAAALSFSEILGDTVKTAADTAVTAGFFMAIAELGGVISDALSSKPDAMNADTEETSNFAEFYEVAEEGLGHADLATSGVKLTQDLAETARKSKKI